MAQQLPTQSQFGDYSDWPGRDVLDASGQRLGAVREIYLDRESGRPEWVLVDLNDSEARFVPLAGADVESWSIRVAQPAEKIQSAPGIGAEPRIDHNEERRLYAHYGLAQAAEAAGWTDRDDASPSWQARGGEPSDSSTTSAPPPTGESSTWSRTDEPSASTSSSPPSESSSWSAADESSSPPRETAAYSPFTGDEPDRTRSDMPGSLDATSSDTTPDADPERGPTGTAESSPPTAWGAPADATPPWRRDAAATEPTNEAPPPAEPPSPSEIEAAQIPDEPPAASDRATDYETAPFGAVAPPPSSGEDAPASFGPRDTTGDATPATGRDDTPASDSAAAFLTDDTTGAATGRDDTTVRDDPTGDAAPATPTRADTPAAGDSAAAFLTDDTPGDAASTAGPEDTTARDDAPPVGAAGGFVTADSGDHYGAKHSPAAPGGDTPTSADDVAPEREVDVTPMSASFAPPEQPASIIPEPPVTADVPEADDSPPGTPELASETPKAPPWSSTSPPSSSPNEPHAGALERVKRSPAKIAVAGVAAAVLFFIVRKLR